MVSPVEFDSLAFRFGFSLELEQRQLQASCGLPCVAELQDASILCPLYHDCWNRIEKMARDRSNMAGVEPPE